MLAARVFHEAEDTAMLVLTIQIIDALACTTTGRRAMMNSDQAAILTLLSSHPNDTIKSSAQRVKDHLISDARKQLGVI